MPSCVVSNVSEALTVDGRPAMLGFGMAPPAAFLPIPGFRSPTWLLPAAALALIVLLLAGLSWPMAFIARRFYGLRSPHVGVALLAYRAQRLSSMATVAVLFTFLGTLLYLSGDFARLSKRTDSWIIGLQLSMLVVVTGGLAVSGWNAVAAWTHSRGWRAKIWAIAVLTSSVTIFWLTLVLRLLIPNTHY